VVAASPARPIVAASAAWVSVWAVTVDRGRAPLALERLLNDLLTGHRPQLAGVARAFASINRPLVFAGVMLAMVALCAADRSVRAAVTLVVALPTTVALVDALKHLDGRINTFGTLTFPSGHVGVTTVLASVAVLLARRHGPLGRRLPGPARLAVMAVAVGSVAAAAASMVVLGAHFVTDTIAAAPLGLSVTLAVAAAADSRARRVLPEH